MHGHQYVEFNLNNTNRIGQKIKNNILTKSKSNSIVIFLGFAKSTILSLTYTFFIFLFPIL